MAGAAARLAVGAGARLGSAGPTAAGARKVLIGGARSAALVADPVGRADAAACSTQIVTRAAGGAAGGAGLSIIARAAIAVSSSPVFAGSTVVAGASVRAIFAGLPGIVLSNRVTE